MATRRKAGGDTLPVSPGASLDRAELLSTPSEVGLGIETLKT